MKPPSALRPWRKSSKSPISWLKKALQSDPLIQWNQWHGEWRTAPFCGHLYQPLLFAGKNLQIKISPVALDRHEAQFVTDLATWCQANVGREVYLLRNRAVTGLGFFQASNFFPDFLLWVQDGETQHLAFVDPKGLLHFDPSDPKVQFASHDIPPLQRTISAHTQNLILHAFVLSNTPYVQLDWTHGGRNRMTKSDCEQLGLLFVDDPTYLPKLMQRIVEC